MARNPPDAHPPLPSARVAQRTTHALPFVGQLVPCGQWLEHRAAVVWPALCQAGEPAHEAIWSVGNLLAGAEKTLGVGLAGLAPASPTMGKTKRARGRLSDLAAVACKTARDLSDLLQQVPQSTLKNKPWTCGLVTFNKYKGSLAFRKLTSPQVQVWFFNVDRGTCSGKSHKSRGLGAVPARHRHGRVVFQRERGWEGIRSLPAHP